MPVLCAETAVVFFHVIVKKLVFEPCKLRKRLLCVMLLSERHLYDPVPDTGPYMSDRPGIDPDLIVVRPRLEVFAVDEVCKKRVAADVFQSLDSESASGKAALILLCLNAE